MAVIDNLSEKLQMVFTAVKTTHLAGTKKIKNNRRREFANTLWLLV